MWCKMQRNLKNSFTFAARIVEYWELVQYVI